MNPEQFYSNLSSPVSILHFLRMYSLVPDQNSKLYEECGSIMRDKFKKRRDGDYSFLFRCNKRYKETSMLKKYFFCPHGTNKTAQKLSLKTILKIVFEYFEDKTHESILINTGLKSKKTIVNWANYIRGVCVIDRQQSSKLGGIGKMVQIDEILSRDRSKYGNGRYLLWELDGKNFEKRIFRRINYDSRFDGPWIFGPVEEETNNIRMFYVDKRDANALIPIINANVEHGSAIISDRLAAYNNLSNFGFTHEVVIHEENYVDPITGANT